MKLYYIVNNALKRKLMDYKSLGMMVVFPILLTFIFITVFGNIDNSLNMSQDEKIEMRIGVYSEAEEVFNNSLIQFLDETAKGDVVRLNYKLITKLEEGVSDLENEQIDILAKIDKARRFTLYEGQDKAQKTGILKGILQAFLEQTALYKIAADYGLQVVNQEDDQGRNYIVKCIKESDKNFFILSIAATMISFAVLMAGSYGSNEVHYISKAVGKRVQSAPLPPNTIYLGEYISGVIMAFMQGSIIAIVSDLFFDIGFRNNPFQMIEILLLLSMMSVAIGICIGALVKNERVSGGIVSVVIMILCFTSGGFNPNMDLGEIIKLSPITVINKSITDICMRQNAQNFNQTLFVTLSFTMACLVIAAISINIKTKEAN